MTQKAASALRDDVKEFLHKLLNLYTVKYKLLKSIYKKETYKRHLLKTDSIPELLELIEIDNELIDRINALDADIMGVISYICKISGIQINDFESTFLNNKDSKIISELCLIINRIEDILTQLIEERDQLIDVMKGKKYQIKHDIKSLTFLRKYRISQK